ncbi:response regulator [Cesiribacter sp. SM1]|uniref:response regulator n=1 Tax=Cesiribacter sp. SM1 TaxID=2861196 RepID=UPI001CD64183|nr:response regulator [Cesiribacter sp. SM1]
MKKVKKILLVDDDEVSCFVHQSILENMHVAEQVLSIHDGIQALNYITDHYKNSSRHEQGQDLLFLDLNMPAMDGFEFLVELKKLQGIDRSRFAIYMLATHIGSQDGENVNMHRDIVQKYILKPLDEETIKAIIREQ